MRKSEFKMKLDPELGRYTRQHIYGEGITDVFKTIGSKIFGKTMKKAAKKGAENSLFQVCLTITKLFSPFDLRETANYLVSQLITNIILKRK